MASARRLVFEKSDIREFLDFGLELAKVYFPAANTMRHIARKYCGIELKGTFIGQVIFKHADVVNPNQQDIITSLEVMESKSFTQAAEGWGSPSQRLCNN